MATLGDTLRYARLQKKVTASQAAEATRIKVQTIEGLENDDFSTIPAPIYGKGFVKMYAEYLRLDPGPLVQKYLLQAGTEPPALPPADSVRAPRMDVVAEKKEPIHWKAVLSGFLRRKLKPLKDLSLTEKLKGIKTSFEEEPWQCVSVGLGVLIVVIFMVSMLSRCAHRPDLSAAPAHEAAGFSTLALR